jgi:hypothetical protein
MLFLLASSAEYRAPLTEADLGQAIQYYAPPGNKVEVRVGLYMLNLVALDEVHQTFTCTGYLTEKWKDPRLSFSSSADSHDKRYYKREDIWFPQLQFDNSAEPRRETTYLLSVMPDGGVEYVVKFAVTVSSNMELRAFPFDSQELSIYVRPFAGDVKRVALTIDPDATGVSGAPFTPLPLWDTGQMNYRLISEDLAGGYTVHTLAVFAMHVKRQSDYYVFKIFLPLTLMVAVSWGALWIPPGDLNSQLVISITTILTLATFSVALSNILPPVPYLTFCDMFFLVCFVFVLFSIGEVLLVHSRHSTGSQQIARQIRGATRRSIPPAFVLAILSLGYAFLR